MEGTKVATVENGWNEYSKLVLEQLAALSAGIDALRGETLQIKQDVAIMKTKEDKVTDLKNWKDRIDEVTSPPQLKSLIEQVQDLKDFKIKAITIFMIVQALTGFILAYTHII